MKLVAAVVFEANSVCVNVLITNYIADSVADNADRMEESCC